MEKKLKIAWVHTFNPKKFSSGIFMDRWADLIKNDFDLEMVYVPLKFTNILKCYSYLQEKTKGFDIIHAQYGSGCGFIVSLLKGRKVLSLRGSDYHVFFNLRYPFVTAFSLLSNLLSRIILWRYSYIITVSERIKNKIPWWLRHKTEVIPDPINTNEFYPIDRQEARKKIGYENDDSLWVTLITINLNNKIKNIELAVKSSVILKKYMPNVKLQVVNNVDPGETVYWINSSNVVLLTSYYEGWPNVIKEALACNVPFVSTDVSDLRSIAKQNKLCKVSESDPKSIARNLLEVLNSHDSRDNLKDFTSRFIVEKCTEELLSVYKKVNK